jgi:hypothetical protein
MSLLRSSLRPPAPVSDETVERHVAAIRASIGPDPLFRRRLRGHVMNRYVATREGIGPPRAVREMGRIGRAVLVASFALSLSVTGAMAASQQSIPGDIFYAMKLQLEELRMRVLPDDLHDELAGHVLAERIAELDRLVASGNPDAIEAQADAVAAAYEAVLALGGPDALADELSVATSLVDRLPEEARIAVQSALADRPGVGPGDNAGTPGAGRDHGGEPPGHSEGRGPTVPAASDAPAATPKPEPTKPPQAQPTKPPQAQPTKPPQAQPTKPPQAQSTKPPQAPPASTSNPAPGRPNSLPRP